MNAIESRRGCGEWNTCQHTVTVDCQCQRQAQTRARLVRIFGALDHDPRPHVGLPVPRGATHAVRSMLHGSTGGSLQVEIAVVDSAARNLVNESRPPAPLASHAYARQCPGTAYPACVPVSSGTDALQQKVTAIGMLAVAESTNSMISGRVQVPEPVPPGAEVPDDHPCEDTLGCAYIESATGAETVQFRWNPWVVVPSGPRCCSVRDDARIPAWVLPRVVMSSSDEQQRAVTS